MAEPNIAQSSTFILLSLYAGPGQKLKKKTKKSTRGK